MDPVSAAALLRDYGPWGAVALCLGALAWLASTFRDFLIRYDAVRDGQISDARVNATALQASTRALEESGRLIAAQGAQMKAMNDAQEARIAHLAATLEHRLDRS